MHEEFQNVISLLLNNDYPRGVTDKHIKTYLTLTSKQKYKGN